MGVRITLYVFQNGPGLITQVYTDSDNLELINAENFTGDGAPSKPSEGTIVNSQCDGTTRYTYRATAFNPYATYEREFDSPYCGGTPPACDIFISSFVVTDETDIDENNGTINMFAISSFGGIHYTAVKSGTTDPILSDTGLFTDLEPGIYFVTARDANGCQVERDGEVHAFSDDFTHLKYRLQFNNVNTLDIWTVLFYDMNNNYLKTDYPIDIAGTDVPILLTQEDQNEDKATAIISKSLDINLWYDAETFTTDEFTLSQERQWYITVQRFADFEFKGWLLPDEIQDLYADAPYPFQLKATDGLPSLKGNVFGDGSGGNGYSNSQVQQYGVTGWGLLVKQCLDQLGYDYGTPRFLSSLQYNSTFNENIWAEIGTWSDILYDTEGVAVDTYTALELLLKGLKLAIIQERGEFVFINWNDMSYRLNTLKRPTYLQSLYELNEAFDNTIINGSSVGEPSVYNIGFDQPNKPINPVQSLNYDKAYNITAKLDFTFLALLYENPSFEIGSTEGDPPAGLEIQGTLSAFAHKEPYNIDNTVPQAYLGDWVLRTTGHIQVLFEGPVPYIQLNGGLLFGIDNERRILNHNAYIIDQVNKKLNFSIQWRPIEYSPDEYVVPTFEIIFFDQFGDVYIMGNNGQWVFPEHERPFYFIQQRTTDYLSWNSYSIQSSVFPGSGLGNLFIAIKPPFRFRNDGTFVEEQGTTDHTIDYDQMLITIVDGNNQYSLQTGEVHQITAVTGIPQANSKEIDLKLFTYPNNKRIAGNVFTRESYESGEVQNKWNFALKTNDPQDRLPATITKSFGRSYQRPMRIFEGDVETNYLSYYAIFILRFYENTVYMPFSIQLDPRNGIGHIRLIEIIDDDQQAIYTYTASYEKDARQIV